MYIKTGFRKNLRKEYLLKKNNSVSTQHPHINAFLVSINKEALNILFLWKFFVQKVFVKSKCSPVKDFILSSIFFSFYLFLHSYCRASYMGSSIPCSQDRMMSWIPALPPNSVKVSYLVYMGNFPG